MTPVSARISSVPMIEMKIEPRHPSRLEKKNTVARYPRARASAPATAVEAASIPRGIGRQQPLTWTFERRRG